jgi:hypothetical protein
MKAKLFEENYPERINFGFYEEIKSKKEEIKEKIKEIDEKTQK